MSKKRRNKKSLHLTDKKHPMLAIIATGLGFLSIVLVFSPFVSFQEHKGKKPGLLIGFGGFICIIISGIGFLAAWASLHQENIRPLFPTIASVVNGLSVVFYFVLYIYGMIL